MTSELYRNFILTVIAVALVLIALRMGSDMAFALGGDGNLVKVMICDDTGRCAKIDPTFDALTVKRPL